MQSTFQHPRALYILGFGELWERFSYYGTQMVLVLYLTKVFLFSDNRSYALYGTFAAFAYAMPVLGGILADRLLGFRLSTICGMVLLIIGYALLATPHLHLFFIGLAITVCGIGIYKPNSLALLGTQYGEQHAHRERGFTWFYLGMNIGGTLGPIVYGLLTQVTGWHVGFIFGAGILFVSLIIYLFHHQHLRTTHHTTHYSKHLIAYCIILLSCCGISWLFLHPQALNNLIIFIAIFIVIALIITAIRQSALARNRIFALLILAVFMMCFYAASLQVGSSINLFIDRVIDRTVFGWTIPTVLFSSLYPLFVIVMVPVLTPFWDYLMQRNKNPAPQMKLFFGVVLAALAFIAFTIATVTHGHYPLMWIVIGNLFLGTGELCLMPATLAAISRFTPHNLHGTMIGVWYLFIALGGYLSGIVAKISNQNADTIANKTLSAAVYQHTFMLIAISTLVVAGLLLMLTPIVKKLLAAEEN